MSTNKGIYDRYVRATHLSHQTKKPHFFLWSESGAWQCVFAPFGLGAVMHSAGKTPQHAFQRLNQKYPVLTKALT